MPEKEFPIENIKPELTLDSVDSTLKTGDVFMAPDSGDQELDLSSENNEEAEEEKDRRREQDFIRQQLRDPQMPVGLRRIYEQLLEGLSGPSAKPADQNIEDKDEEKDLPKSIQEAVARGVMEGMAAMNANAARFEASSLVRESKDVPDSFSYEVINPETGETETKVANLRPLKGEHILGDARRAAEQNRMRATKEIHSARLDLNTHIATIESSEDYFEVREAVNGFIKDIEKVIDLLSDNEKEILNFEVNMGKLSPRDGEENLSPNEKRKRIYELKAIVEQFAPYMRSHYMEVEEERRMGEDMPKSLEDLARLASSRAKGEFALGGPKSLIYKEGEEDRVSLANFYEWVRDQMWRVHDFNSTSEVNFFDSPGMGIQTTFRTINFFEIVFTPSFFHQKRKAGKHRIEQDGTVKKELIDTYNENQDYEKLRETLLYEVYVFQLLRNADFVYRTNMAGIKGMTQALEGIYKTNPLTKDDYLERILSLPAMSRMSLGEKSGRGEMINNKLENNFLMGDAVRTALSVYSNIWDFEAVKNILGENSNFFQRDYDEYDDKGRKKEEKKRGSGEGYKGKKWFDENGRIKDLDDKEKKEYMVYMNIFRGPDRESEQKQEVKDRVVQSLMQRKGISYTEAKLAEAWAYSLMRITGIAARNDTESVGFDQWTKQTNLEPYRQRQISERRKAKYGSIYTMAHPHHKEKGPGLKRVTLTLAEALRDTGGRALYEIIQGGQAGRIDLDNNPIKQDIDFEARYKRDAAGNILFVDYDGNIISQEELDKNGIYKEHELGEVNTYEVDDTGKVRFKNKKGEYVEPHEADLRPVKESIIFRDREGNEVEELRGKVVAYKLDEHANPTYYDKDRNIVDVGEYMSRIVKRDVKKVRFGEVTLQQFMANVINESAGWYEFVIDGKEMGFLEMFKGYNTTGEPMIDVQKLNELRSQIRKHITYSLSTWRGTDYTKKIRTWEALTKEQTGYDPDPNNKEKNHEMSILRSMFGDEALAFIQLELWSKTRNNSSQAKEAFEGSPIQLSDIDVFRLENYHNVLTDAQKRELKICIWEGAFTYMIAKDVWRHRAPDSNDKRWSFDEVKQVYDILNASQLLNEEEMPDVKEHTATKTGRLFGEELMLALGVGDLEGLWQMLQAMIKQQSLV